MKTILHLFLAIGAAICPLPRESLAGCHHVRVIQQQAAVVYQPVNQPYYWAVGQNFQEDAQAQRIAAKVLQLMQAAPQVQQQTAPCPTCQTPAPQTLPLQAPEVDRWALVRQSCVGCHESNTDAKAAVDMSDLDTLTCEQKLNCIRQLVDGAMPRGKRLDPSLLGDLIGTFSGSDQVGK